MGAVKIMVLVQIAILRRMLQTEALRLLEMRLRLDLKTEAHRKEPLREPVPSQGKWLDSSIFFSEALLIFS